MKHYYSAQRKYGKWRGVVYHWSNIHEEQIVDYRSEEVESEWDAYKKAFDWAEENGIEVEMD